ncbi:MAG: PAS domain S-box protein [Muricauda sp.]|nr:PAS domain S-box protein [Allomuricauda sp.]MBA4746882.1 PAS domain S-box protein [Allomuricauda sp.]
MNDYSTLFHLGPCPTWIYAVENNKILEANRRALELLGYEREELLSLKVQDIVQGDVGHDLNSNGMEDCSGLRRTCVKGKSGELLQLGVFFQRVVFGNRNCIMVTGKEINEDQGEGTLYSPNDVKEMRASQIAKVGYWKYDIEKSSLTLSDSVFDIWGRKRDEFELTVENIFNCLPIEDQKIFNDELNALFYGERQMDFVHRVMLPEGGMRWIRERGKLNRTPEGKPVSFEGSIQDITFIKNEEEHLRLLQSAVTHSTDGIMITEAGPLEGPGPKILYVNRAFAQMTGYREVELIGKTPDILRGPKTDKNELEQLNSALLLGESSEVVLTNYRKNGTPFYINIAVSPVKDNNGTVSHYIAIQRDVTSRVNERLEKELLDKISGAFRTKLDLQAALRSSCQLITSYGRYSFCEIWLPNLNKANLRLCSSYSRISAGQKFYEHTGSFTETSFDGGLVGDVWRTKQMVLWGNLGSNKQFIRNEAARLSGIKSALGIPLKHGDSIVGVLIIGSEQGEKDIKLQYPALAKLESHIGFEVYRKRIEDDLQHLKDTLPDLVCTLDFKGRFLEMNKVGCEMLGYELSEIQKSNYMDFVHPEDRTSSDAMREQIMNGQNIKQNESRYITKEGNVIWLHWHWKVLVEDGVVYATAKNITDSKRLAHLVDDASHLAKIGGWEIDLVSDRIIWSEGVHQIYETDPESYEPKLKEAIGFYREDYREKVSRIIEQVLNTGAPFDYEAAFISAEGNEKWVRAIGRAEMIGDRYIRLFGSFQDITNLKKTEQRLQSITNDLPGVAFQYIVYPDGTDRLNSVSQKSMEVWGLPPEACEMDTEPIWNQIREGGAYEKLQGEIRDCIKTLTQWHSRWRSVLPDGQIRWHEGYGTPHRLPDGTVVFNSMIFDITEEMKLSYLLEETSELARIGSWELDFLEQRNTERMYWSPMTKEIMEIEDTEDASLSKGLGYCHKKYRDGLEQSINDLIGQGKEFDAEVILITGTGREKWVRIIGKSERIKGVCTKIYGSIQDIHTMKTTQLRLQEILGSISDAFYAVDNDWNFTYFNKESENLLGRKRNDVLGKNLWKLFSPALGTELETVYKRVAKKGKAESFEYHYPENGSWYEVNAYPSNDGGLSVYFKNIDERKRADEKILYKTKQLDILAEMNSELLNYEDWFKVIDKTFARVGRCVNVDRIYYFQNSFNEETGELETSQRLEWSKEGMSSQINNPLLQNVPFSLVQDFMQPLSQNNPFKAIVREMQDSDTKRLLLEQGIKSILVFPIKVDKKFWGFVGFDDCTIERTWSGDDISFLKTISSDVSSAIETSEANRKLKKAYEEKDEILDSIGDAFYTVDKHWIVTYWNRQAERILKKKRKVILGKNLWEEFTDAVNLEFYRQHQRAMETGKKVSFEEFYPPLGKWLEVTAYPSPNGLSVYFKDVSEKKTAEIKVLRANERFEKVTLASKDAIWDWDIEENVIFRGNGLKKLFSSETVGKLGVEEVWDEAVFKEDLPMVRSSVREALHDTSREFWEMDYRILDHEGNIKTVIDKAAIIRDSKGDAVRMVGATTDISDRIKYEQELEELNGTLQKNISDLERTNDQLEQFAFVASHDLQEPLRMISSFLNQLQRKYGDQLDEKAHQYIHFATDGASRMKQIILDLLDYSRAGRGELSAETIDLNKVMDEYKVLRARLIEQRTVTINTEGLPQVTCYGAPLVQTIHCLMDNAIKYSREGVPPEVKISVMDRECHWEVRVQDNGIGIDSKYFEKVFVIFQRLHGREAYGGTGMGLAISKKNVESWGGKIWVESEIGKGSSFYFTINK